MTQTQLRYWELRWKQYYESLYIKVQQKDAETRRISAEIERAKAQETARHNRAEERHEQQRIIQENIKLSQKAVELAQTWKKIEHEAEGIKQNWAKIKQTDKANMVHYAIEAFKAETERTRVQNQFLVDMGSLQVAEQETALAAIKASSENDRKWFENMVKMGQEAFGLKIEIPEETPLIGGSEVNLKAGGVVTGLLFGVSQLVRRWLPNEYDHYQSNLKSIAKTTLENYGPQAESKIGDLVNKAYNIPKESTDASESDNSERSVVTGFNQTETKRNTSESTGVTISEGSGKTGSTRESVTITPKDGSSGIIYSPGSHYGPGWNL